MRPLRVLRTYPAYLRRLYRIAAADTWALSRISQYSSFGLPGRRSTAPAALGPSANLGNGCIFERKVLAQSSLHTQVAQPVPPPSPPATYEGRMRPSIPTTYCPPTPPSVSPPTTNEHSGLHASRLAGERLVYSHPHPASARRTACLRSASQRWCAPLQDGNTRYLFPPPAHPTSPSSVGTRCIDRLPPHEECVSRMALIRQDSRRWVSFTPATDASILCQDPASAYPHPPPGADAYRRRQRHHQHPPRSGIARHAHHAASSSCACISHPQQC
ncbi:hypothetical protein C8R44DRAFT_879617 [Mycena epipterygia]|nr:hypothetical protein C8R44DRAFT_879617 [Mycena epipterygia]